MSIVKEENTEIDEEVLTVKQEDIAGNIQLRFDESVRRQPLSSFIRLLHSSIF